MVNGSATEVLEAFGSAIKKAERVLTRCKGASASDETAHALLHILQRALQVAEAAFVAARRGHPEPFYILVRGLYERVILAFWITRSDENAEEFKRIARSEVVRDFRKILKAGEGRVVERASGTDRTADILAACKMQEVPSRVRLQTLAEKVGLGTLHTRFSGYFSQQAHGFNFGLPDDPVQEVHMLSAAGGALIEALATISSRWILDGQRVSVATLDGILQFSGSRPPTCWSGGRGCPGDASPRPASAGG